VLVDYFWNVMAHAQKPDFVFRRNGWVDLNWRGCQSSRLLAAEVCASAVVMVVMLDTPCSRGGVKGTGYPLHSAVSPSLPFPCITVSHHVSTGLYNSRVLCEVKRSFWALVLEKFRTTRPRTLTSPKLESVPPGIYFGMMKWALTSDENCLQCCHLEQHRSFKKIT